MEPLRKTFQSMRTNTKSCWNTIDEMGGDTSKPHNLQNLAEAIRSIPQSPAVPTSLAELKELVNRGREIVIGTEIPDTWNGHSNPLIVGTNTKINGKKAVGLLRYYTEGYGTAYGTSGTSLNYVGSVVLNYLQTTYLNNCSEDLKSIISETAVPYYNGSTTIEVSSKWHLFSDAEVYSNRVTWQEGVAWEYWKERTGLSAPSDAANNGRIVRSTSNSTQYWWLRSLGPSSNVCSVSPDGSITGAFASNSGRSVYPFCYIVADK